MTEIENPMATSSDVNSFADLERWLDEHSVTEVECLCPICPASRAARSCRATASPKNAGCACRKEPSRSA